MYLNVRAAELASRALGDREDQRRFVASVRSALAGDIERGKRCRRCGCASAERPAWRGSAYRSVGNNLPRVKPALDPRRDRLGAELPRKIALPNPDTLPAQDVVRRRCMKVEVRL
jgi:hypothetical protein